jgi:glycosyltransferase involved in cell wall biosynthesis
VITNWKRGNFFIENQIYYLSTVNESGIKLAILIMSLLRYFAFCIQRPKSVIYIHTASFHSFYRKSLFLAVAIFIRKRVILHIHPSYFYHFINGFKGIKKELFFSLLRRCSCFVVLTSGMEKDMKKLFPEMPINVLPNPVNIDATSLENIPEREPNRILFLGWFNRGKGVYDLVDAALILAAKKIDFKLDFFGTKEVEQLKAYVSKRNLEGYVTVHGWADEETKLMALYRSAALVIPSHTEGIPNVVLEAMATRTPIIATRMGGLADILRDGDNAVVIEPKNPHDIAEKIEFVLNNSAYCRKLADRAFQDAKQNYDLPVIKSRLQAILNPYADTVS